MPLYDAQNTDPIDPAVATRAVHRFLTQCHAWAAEQEIPKRLARVEVARDPLEAAKLHEWVAYLRFTEHALAELEKGELDDWFRGPQA